MLSAADAGAPLTVLASRLRAGAISAEALLDACLAAIAAHDGGADGLHAILTLNPDAREDARRCDADRRAGRALGSLHGVPLVVKDNIDVAGLPTTSGNRALANAFPARNAAMVVRLKDAGAVVVGKSNLSEFSFEIRSRSSLGGDVRNPFLRSVTAGGSSGGTAAAVAAGFAVAGLGTDTGGSIRVPASYNGLVGLRPTYERLSLAGVAPLAPSTDTIGPIARSVADARLLWTVLSGCEPTVRSATGLRVGVLRQAFGDRAEIAAAAARAIAALVDADVAIVDPVLLPDGILPINRPHIVDTEFAGAFDSYLASNFDADGPLTLAAIQASGDHLRDYDAALAMRLDPAIASVERRASILAEHAALRESLVTLMDQEGLAALLYPTSMTIPESLDNPPGGWAPELAACSGWPALNLPAGRARSGVPIGVELLARADGEATLFALGELIEQVIGPRLFPTLA